MRVLNRRLVRHYNYYGLRGNSRDLWRFYQVAIESAFKWLNRRGGKRRNFTWAGFTHALKRLAVIEKTIRGRYYHHFGAGARRLYERFGYRERARRAMVKEKWQHPGTDWVLLVK